MIQQIQSSKPAVASDADIESLHSEQSEMDDDTAFALPESEPEFIFSDSETEYSDSSGSTIFQLQPFILSNQHIPSPHVQAQILLDKYDKPINVVVYIDTGAYKSMLDLKVLPSQYWTPHEQHFKAANG
ncbi:hypothetical protein ACOSQ2_006808 [Xanthoceras sorbifolium]